MPVGAGNDEKDQSGNDGKVEPAMTERAEEAAVVLKNVTKYVFHDKTGTS